MSVYTFKVLLVGDPNVGKSSLIRRILLGEFDEEYMTTIGVDLSAVVIEPESGSPVILTVIDLGGQKEFSNLRTHYYKDAHHSVLVYDISDRKSFDALPEWLDGMNVALAHIDRAPPIGLLLGNKADIDRKRAVLQEEGQKYADTLGWKFMETSAKSGQNVEEAFLTIAKQLVESQ